ncbi:MAG: ATP-binding cassette domain-containing protein [bacterium]|nr:ATP-binding cassette domain-containing protein [bacterium]
MSIIEVKNLTKSYGSFKAVDNISFEVGSGEIVGFLGPNGAGKTTTLRIVTGYFPPTVGTCKIMGFDIEKDPIPAKTKTGYIPENNPLYSEMKIMEYLAFIGQLRKVEKLNDRIKEVVAICGLKSVISKAIGELSKGYKQRVGLAQAIIHNPEILIMDEPTEGLDPNQIVEVRELIKTLGEKKTVIISTHRLSEVEATCKRVIIINRGKIIADAPKDEMHKLAAGKTIVELELKAPKDKAMAAIKEMAGVKNVKATSSQGETTQYEIETDPTIDMKETIFKTCVSNNWVIVGLQQKTASLEDIFRELTKEN